MKIRLLGILLVLFFSCKNYTEKSSDNHPIETVCDLSKTETVLESTLYDSVELIPLETIKASLVGTPRKILYKDSIIYLLDEEVGSGLIAFTLEGKFMWRIKPEGKGPNEFAGQIKDFDVFDNNVYILSDQGEVICLNNSGSIGWIKQLKYYPRHMCKLPDGFAFGMEYHSMVKADLPNAYYDLILTNEALNTTENLFRYTNDSFVDRFRSGYSLCSGDHMAAFVPNLSDSIVIIKPKGIRTIKVDFDNDYSGNDLQDKSLVDKLGTDIDHIYNVLHINDSIVTFSFRKDLNLGICSYNYKRSIRMEAFFTECDMKTLPMIKQPLVFEDNIYSSLIDPMMEINVAKALNQDKNLREAFHQQAYREIMKIAGVIDENANPVLVRYHISGKE